MHQTLPCNFGVWMLWGLSTFVGNNILKESCLKGLITVSIPKEAIYVKSLCKEISQQLGVKLCTGSMHCTSNVQY